VEPPNDHIIILKPLLINVKTLQSFLYLKTILLTFPSEKDLPGVLYTGFHRKHNLTKQTTYHDQKPEAITGRYAALTRSSLICWENNRTNNKTMDPTPENNKAAWYQGPMKLEVVKSCVVSSHNHLSPNSNSDKHLILTEQHNYLIKQRVHVMRIMKMITSDVLMFNEILPASYTRNKWRTVRGILGPKGIKSSTHDKVWLRSDQLLWLVKTNPHRSPANNKAPLGGVHVCMSVIWISNLVSSMTQILTSFACPC